MLKLSAAAKVNAMKRYLAARSLRGQVVVGCSLFHHCMKLLDKIGREFSDYHILEPGKRLLDRKPLQAVFTSLSLPSLVVLSGFLLYGSQLPP